jgi:hypothetical protein
MVHQPIGVRGGDDPILTTLHQQNRRLDPRHVKPPVSGEGQIVVDLTVGSGGVGPVPRLHPTRPRRPTALPSRPV